MASWGRGEAEELWRNALLGRKVVSAERRVICFTFPRGSFSPVSRLPLPPSHCGLAGAATPQCPGLSGQRSLPPAPISLRKHRDTLASDAARAVSPSGLPFATRHLTPAQTASPARLAPCSRSWFQAPCHLHVNSSSRSPGGSFSGMSWELAIKDPELKDPAHKLTPELGL